MQAGAGLCTVAEASVLPRPLPSYSAIDNGDGSIIERTGAGSERITLMMRFTVVDQNGTVSFVGPCHALKALAAACSRGAVDHRGLISLLGEYDSKLQEEVTAGLHVFDEHNTKSDPRAIHTLLDQVKPAASPPFRVIDERTRNVSLEPVRYGLVVFNLAARRIVQVQNSYAT